MKNLLRRAPVAFLLLASACSADGPARAADPAAADLAADGDAPYRRCVAEGGLLLKSFPPQCLDGDGVRHVMKTASPVPSASPAPAASPCADRCGDGTCQEVTCAAEGCPCAETAATCPGDCRPG